MINKKWLKQKKLFNHLTLKPATKSLSCLPPIGYQKKLCSKPQKQFQIASHQEPATTILRNLLFGTFSSIKYDLQYGSVEPCEVNIATQKLMKENDDFA